MRQSATFRRTLANGAPPLDSPAAGYAPRRAWTIADLQRTDARLLRDASADTLTGSDIARALDARALDALR